MRHSFYRVIYRRLILHSGAANEKEELALHPLRSLLQASEIFSQAHQSFLNLVQGSPTPPPFPAPTRTFWALAVRRQQIIFVGQAIGSALLLFFLSSGRGACKSQGKIRQREWKGFLGAFRGSLAHERSDQHPTTASFITTLDSCRRPRILRKAGGQPLCTTSGPILPCNRGNRAYLLLVGPAHFVAWSRTAHLPVNSSAV